MLLVTFDEHGGTFDHVPPPAAVPPGPMQNKESNFGFDRLGVRVPAIAISAYTQANTVIHSAAHHGTVIKTLCEKYQMPHLTERDRTAIDLSDAINVEGAARDPKTWPVPVARPVPQKDIGPGVGLLAEAETELNGLERHVVGMAIAAFEEKSEIPKTIGEAKALLDRIAGGAFGRNAAQAARSANSA